MVALLMATPSNSCSFYNNVIESGKLCDCKYFLTTMLFVKTKEMSVKNSLFYFVHFSRFSVENILRLFKNTASRARVDQDDIRFAFCMKNWFLGWLVVNCLSSSIYDVFCFVLYLNTFFSLNVTTIVCIMSRF